MASRSNLFKKSPRLKMGKENFFVTGETKKKNFFVTGETNKLKPAQVGAISKAQKYQKDFEMSKNW